ncbi:Nitrate transporter 1.7 [Glycine soja]|uniref:Nitrate transporter 1.7 n=1 Tax=Glycine soja TaxID=3848 RepID=A0A0B2SL71_GLYSO|nr:Nitrate transporter 1.7 [Glycine soja]
MCGIGPCTIPIAIDQFDTTFPVGRKGVNNFFNWYYTSQTVVFVAAYKKHHLKIPVKEEEGVCFDPLVDDKAPLKLPLTKQLRCLNKAALIQDNDLNTEDCVKNPWRICNIQQMEEVKCLIKMLPI